METIQIPDEHLKRLAEEERPRSAAAVILRSLAKKRAKDRQVVAAWPILFRRPNS